MMPSAISQPSAESCLAKAQIFFGEATDALARVYVSLPQPVDGNLTLHGSITGPECAYARTLTATYALREMRSETTGDERWLLRERHTGELFAHALISEPCFWTPDLPNQYRCEIELRDGAKSVASTTRIFGIRRLGASGTHLIFDAKRWVLRAISADEVRETSLAQWRDAFAAIMIERPDDEQCEAASRAGVLIVAALRAAGDRQDELQRVARHAAVGIAVLPDMPGDPEGLRSLRPNLLLAQYVHSGENVVPASWAHLLIVGVDDPAAFARRTIGVRLPVIAFRRAGPQTDIATARRLCDHLQRDLAPFGQYAGYLV